LLRDPMGVRLRVVPAHTDYRTVAAAPVIVVRLSSTGCLGKAIVLLERHLVFPQSEAPDRHGMHWSLVEPAAAALHAAHLKHAARNRDHLAGVPHGFGLSACSFSGRFFPPGGFTRGFGKTLFLTALRFPRRNACSNA